MGITLYAGCRLESNIKMDLKGIGCQDGLDSADSG
jgi:hypothetical protein